jgi:hypothetical protein
LQPTGAEVSTTHIAGLLKLLPVLTLVSEIRIKNRLARTLLETYVGSHAGELILAGATRRGSGMTVRAAIMICDLRDFRNGASSTFQRHLPAASAAFSAPSGFAPSDAPARVRSRSALCGSPVGARSLEMPHPRILVAAHHAK